jgi:hypothetical protein
MQGKSPLKALDLIFLSAFCNVVAQVSLSLLLCFRLLMRVNSTQSGSEGKEAPLSSPMPSASKAAGTFSQAKNQFNIEFGLELLEQKVENPIFLKGLF